MKNKTQIFIFIFILSFQIQSRNKNQQQKLEILLFLLSNPPLSISSSTLSPPAARLPGSSSPPRLPGNQLRQPEVWRSHTDSDQWLLLLPQPLIILIWHPLPFPQFKISPIPILFIWTKTPQPRSLWWYSTVWIIMVGHKLWLWCSKWRIRSVLSIPKPAILIQPLCIGNDATIWLDLGVFCLVFLITLRKL